MKKPLVILMLAILCWPVKAQKDNFLDLDFGMFIHYNMATYQGVQWVEGYPDPADFDPGVETINTDAWADAAVSAGMKYAVLTVKHVAGFCLWDSKYTTYDLMHPNCPYQKDLVSQFINSFKSRGLKVGLYYCWRHPGFDANKKNKEFKVLPPECDPSTHTLEEQVAFQKAQIAELIAKYPDVFYIWNDALDPEIMESGDALDFFNSIDSDILVSGNWWDWSKKGTPYADVSITEMRHFPENNTAVGETCWQLEQKWFWNGDTESKSAESIIDLLKIVNSNNANLLLNVGPDQNGNILNSSIKTLGEIGEMRGKNAIETYQVSWWYMPISFGLSGNWARPGYGIINIDNGELVLRHALIEGRPLGDYKLPYWPKTSFVSLSSNSAELAHQSNVSITQNGKRETFPFRCGDPDYRGSDAKLSIRMKRIKEGFELARIKESDILKVSNKGSGAPILMEHHFVVSKGSRDIPVIIKATNQSDQIIQDVVLKIIYKQDFNWSSFGSANSGNYHQIKAPSSGTANSFFAFSSGMQRGFEFSQINGGELSYTLNQDLNAWEVVITNLPGTLDPGESLVFDYKIRIIDQVPKKTSRIEILSGEELNLLEFQKVKPAEIRSAPVTPDERVTIQDVFLNLEKPKVRGLHCISGPEASADLEMLKNWGGNLAIAGPHGGGNTDETKKIIQRGKELDIEMLVAGKGYYDTGLPPEFDHFFSAKPEPMEFPDSYGQDEDHSYWYPEKPTLDFEREFGKPMSMATLKEEVEYWSRCFVDKWKRTLTDVRKNDPDGNIWFYTPTPNMPFIDPLDYHDLFFKEVSELGDDLTVFPFYYGDDYNQIEYMMRSWKKAGAHRAVFLPGAPTYSRPSQFIRAITAARRGGADGACGFAFSLGVADQFGFLSFDHEWRWKALMLGSYVNFPTPELNSYSLLENPADLVEALAVSDVMVYSGESDHQEFGKKLETLIPGQVQLIQGLPEEPPQSDELYVIIGNGTTSDDAKWLHELHIQDAGTNKGIVQMTDNIINLNGSDIIGLQNAKILFVRFAEMAKVEGLYN